MTDAPDRGQWTVAGIPIRVTTSPALNILQRDRLELLEGGDNTRAPELKPLRDQFDDRRELINWYQAALVRTLGYLDVYAPPELLVHSSLVADGLVAGDDAPLDALQVDDYIDHMFQPAYEHAYDDLESNSQEWTGQGEEGGDYRDIQTTTEKNVAFKPAFRLLDEEQADVLKAYWRGFDDERALRQWAGGLTAVTRPLHKARTWRRRRELPQQPLQELIMSDSVAVDYLQVDVRDAGELGGEVAEAFEYKFAFAASVLLPAMALKARTLQYNAEEAAGGPRGRGAAENGNISSL